MDSNSNNSKKSSRRLNHIFWGCLAVLTFFFGHRAMANTSVIEEARTLFLKGEKVASYEKLSQIELKNLDPTRRALVYLFQGILSFDQAKYQRCLGEMDLAIKFGSRLMDVAHYYQGLSHFELGEINLSEKALKKVSGKRVSSHLNEKALYHLALIALKRDHRKTAKTQLKKLERKLRRSDIYPDILWSLVTLYQKDNKKSESCYWAGKLYRSHPNYSHVEDWGLEWKNNLVRGKSLKCKDSLADRKARLRRLQWSGASDKAFRELQVFEGSDEEPYTKDIMMAEYLINEGHVNEALKKLLPHYPKNSDDFKYTMLLAKAASRAGEFQMAIGIYTKAARTFRNSKSRTSLFRAAFLSYQFQDYDGAIRLFSELKRNHPKSSLTKQANWYITWLYYLRGNHQKAYDLMAKILKKRTRHVPRRISKTQIQYWMAMSLKKMGKMAQAKKLFSEISQDDFVGYYSVASVHRLKELMGDRSLAFSEQIKMSTLHENWLPSFMGKIKKKAVDFSQVILRRTNQNFFEEWATLPFMQEYKDIEDNPSSIYSKVVNKPVLRAHIDRAKDMSLIGLQELAKWELYSIEKITKNKDHLKTLMFEYHRNEIFHRSSYIGSRHFAKLRTHLGLHLGASLWQFVYPRAYEENVVSSGNKFNVPPEFVWSIMKAETNFRPDARSPVGAKGLMQVMTHTGRKVASLMGTTIEGDDLLKPDVSIEIGTRYLQRVLKKFHRKIPLAAAAYNGGPHRVHAWISQFGHLDMDEFIEHIPFLETRNYVKKVVRYYSVYNLLYNKNTEASSWLAEPVDVQLEGSSPTKETWEVL